MLTPLLVLLLFAAVDTARLMGAKQRQDQQTLEVARFLAWHPDAGVGDAVAVIGLDDSCVTEADIDVDAVTVGTRCEFRPELFRDWIGLPLSSTATAAAMPSPEPAPAPSASPEPSGGAS